MDIAASVPPKRERPSRQCGADGCEQDRATGSAHCDVHTHDWVVLGEVALDPRFAAGAARTNYTEIRESTWVRVLEVVCSSCRQTFERARHTPCEAEGVHLRGGPIGVRQKRVDDEGEDRAGVAGDTHPLDAVASGS